MATRVLLLLNLALLPVVGSAEPTEPVYPRARPLTDRTFEPSPIRLERGRYLTEHLLQCFACHSERDWGAPGAPPVAGRKGAGVVMSERGERRIVAPNITPDVATGAGGWTDDMLARAIREGIGHDGRALYWGMWYQSFAGLSDEDLAAVVVYLRTLPPVRNALPPTVLPADERAANARSPQPIAAPVTGPAPGDAYPVAHYIGNTGEPRHCEVCGQEHPFGQYNRLVLPKSVPVAAAVLERLPGTYRSEEFDWTIEVRRDAGKLYARENGGTTDIELIALSSTRYLGSGLVTPVEFTLPVAGAATRLVSFELQEIVLERVR